MPILDGQINYIALFVTRVRNKQRSQGQLALVANSIMFFQ